MHYGVGVVPARPCRPRDKAKVVVGVQIVKRWIIAALRHHRFFRREEVNRAIRELLKRLNQRPFRKREGSRALKLTSRLTLNLGLRYEYNSPQSDIHNEIIGFSELAHNQPSSRAPRPGFFIQAIPEHPTMHSFIPTATTSRRFDSRGTRQHGPQG